MPTRSVVDHHDFDDVPTVDLNDAINHYRDVIGDDDWPVDTDDYFTAVRAVYDAAARVLDYDLATSFERARKQHNYDRRGVHLDVNDDGSSAGPAVPEP